MTPSHASHLADAAERARRHRRAIVIEHVVRDRARWPGEPWRCRCQHCETERGDVAIRALARREYLARIGAAAPVRAMEGSGGA